MNAVNTLVEHFFMCYFSIMNNSPRLPNHITAVILSGGAGSRFGGVDKGLEHYRGKPLIAHVLEKIKSQVDGVVLCINRNRTLYQQYNHPLVFDLKETDDQDHQGPLAGIISALTYLSKNDHTDFILVSSCDSPDLPHDYVNKLLQAIKNHNASSALVHDGVRGQNLHCLIHRSAWQSLFDFYRSGGRAMYQWHKKNGSVEVNFSNRAACFLNINSIQDLT